MSNTQTDDPHAGMEDSLPDWAVQAEPDDAAFIAQIAPVMENMGLRMDQSPRPPVLDPDATPNESGLHTDTTGKQITEDATPRPAEQLPDLSNFRDDTPTPNPDNPDNPPAPAQEDAPPATPQTQQPITDPNTDPATPPAEQSTTPPPSQYVTLEVDGTRYDITQEQVEALVAEHNWIESIPDPVRRQWAGIQDGTHVAIPREELARLTGGTPTPPRNQTPDLSDIDDPDVLDYIARLEASQATQDAPPRQAPTPMQQPTTDSAPLTEQELMVRAQRNMERQNTIQASISTVRETFKEEYGLTDEQVQRLDQVTSSSGIVPTLVNQRVQRDPITNNIIRDPDYSAVMKDAYAYAFTTDPELRQVMEDHVFQQRLAQNNEANKRANEKKGRAASLSAAPSAAVPANPGGGIPSLGPGNRMDLSATSAAVAAALRDAQSTP